MLYDDLFGDPAGSPFETDLSKPVAGLYEGSENTRGQAGSQPPRSVGLFPPTHPDTLQDQRDVNDHLSNDSRGEKRNEPMGLIDTPAPEGLRPTPVMRKKKHSAEENDKAPTPVPKGIGIGEYIADGDGARLVSQSVRGATPVPAAKDAKPKKDSQKLKEKLWK